MGTSPGLSGARPFQVTLPVPAASAAFTATAATFTATAATLTATGRPVHFSTRGAPAHGPATIHTVTGAPAIPLASAAGFTANALPGGAFSAYGRSIAHMRALTPDVPIAPFHAVVPAITYPDVAVVVIPAVAESPMCWPIFPAHPAVDASPSKPAPPSKAAAIPAWTVPTVKGKAIPASFNKIDRGFLNQICGVNSVPHRAARNRHCLSHCNAGHANRCAARQHKQEFPHSDFSLGDPPIAKRADSIHVPVSHGSNPRNV